MTRTTTQNENKNENRKKQHAPAHERALPQQRARYDLVVPEGHSGACLPSTRQRRKYKGVQTSEAIIGPVIGSPSAPCTLLLRGGTTGEPQPKPTSPSATDHAAEWEPDVWCLSP